MSKGDPNRLNHAKHNEEVCEYLSLKPEYSDWVITTAFYSSLHYISFKVFPIAEKAISGKTTTINNVDEYIRYKNGKRTKHQLLADLAANLCPKISPDYDWLLDISMNARYINYFHDSAISKKAISIMRTIKKECSN